jgi:hypothetical protein
VQNVEEFFPIIYIGMVRNLVVELATESNSQEREAANEDLLDHNTDSVHCSTGRVSARVLANS